MFFKRNFSRIAAILLLPLLVLAMPGFSAFATGVDAISEVGGDEVGLTLE